MEKLWPTVGWALYIVTCIYALSGGVYVWYTIKGGKAVSWPVYFQLTVATVCAVFFGVEDLSKAHLAWIIPATTLMATSFEMTRRKR